MKYRRFGRTGWRVSEIGYGMWGMGGWSGSDDEESLRSLQRAVELGCNFFDTAWAYGAGRSESLLGRLVRANPERRLFTATKIPPKNFKVIETGQRQEQEAVSVTSRLAVGPG
jgi:aryl-alcohol dehydrogenase-like predicted oxidoreductase